MEHPKAEQHWDVIIVGAGFSGISAAVHLQKHCPQKSFCMLEARSAFGGTWDLFRYPGIRSDSDMYTQGFAFQPWNAPEAIAPAGKILNYLEDTLDQHQLKSTIRYGHKLCKAHWSSQDSRWILDIQLTSPNEETSTIQLSCGFLSMCGGYYSYEKAHDPGIDMSLFQGRVVHPQFWPEDLDYRGKRVIIIGSGATAMTLVPSMAQDFQNGQGGAAHVTMLQRSPTWVVAIPTHDWFATLLNSLLPSTWAYSLIRKKNIWFQRYIYRRSRTHSKRIRQVLLHRLYQFLPKEYVAKHFTPSYRPWDQRLCAITDGDMFDVIRSGKASVVTDSIDEILADGIRTKSGQHLKADIIVTATGLQLTVLSGVQFTVDGQPVDIGKTFTYNGLMLSSLPNMVYTFGYLIASWTLRADLVSEYICRLLKYMDQIGATKVTPTLRSPEDDDMTPRPHFEIFSSGYLERSNPYWPKQGHDPWTNHQNYYQNKQLLRSEPVRHNALKFTDTNQKEVVDDRVQDSSVAFFGTNITILGVAGAAAAVLSATCLWKGAQR